MARALDDILEDLRIATEKERGLHAHYRSLKDILHQKERDYQEQRQSIVALMTENGKKQGECQVALLTLLEEVKEANYGPR